MSPKTLLSIALSIAALSPVGRSSPLAGAQVVVPPVLVPNPNPNAPLAATVTLVTDVPTQVVLVLQDGIRPPQRFLAEKTFKTNHAVQVLGGHAGIHHDVRVELIDQAGVKTVWGPLLSFDPPALPAGFPPLDITVANTVAMEPGVTLFDATSTRSMMSASFLVILDKYGEPIWYYHNPLEAPREVKRMRSGNLIFISANHVVEIDMLGNHVQEWWPTALGAAGVPLGATHVDVDSFHHEITELPEAEVADFLSMGSELRVYANYPTSESDTTMTAPVANVVGDTILEFNRDGTVVKEMKILDILDPYRLSWDSLGNFWSPTYMTTTRDWSHGNAVVIDPADNTYVMSLRHQDALVKVDRDSGEIKWILGPHERWTAPWDQYLLTPIVTGTFGWQYHQHGPHKNAAGNWVMWDNGNRRTIPPELPLPANQWYSRAVEFQINPVAMTVKQIWAYGGPVNGFLSTFLGDADPMPTTNNVLVADGAKGLPPSLLTGRVAEVTHQRPPVLVFEALINDQSAQPASWTIYRGERLKGIYP